MLTNVVKSLIILCLFAITCISKEAFSISLTGKIIANNYRYTEYDNDNIKLNEESAVLVGQEVGLSHPFLVKQNTFTFGIYYQRFNDTTPYDGQTQVGIPLKSTTDQDIEHYRFSIEKALHQQIDIFTQYGFHQRNRHIRATDTTTELSEIYKWQEIAIGLNAYLSAKRQWYLRAYLFNVISPEVEVNTHSDAIGKHQLQQGEKPGFLLSIGTQTSFQNWHFKPELGIKYQAFGASNTQSFIRNNLRISIQEPQSITLSRYFSASISYQW